jgi:bacillopeptidase F (M6 metalloprotease family)
MPSPLADQHHARPRRPGPRGRCSGFGRELPRGERPGPGVGTGSADGLNQSITRSVPAASRVTVKAGAWYEIEADYDYLFAEYSLDGGANWSRAGAAVDGSSGDKWTTLRYAYDSQDRPSLFRFRYQTDGGVHFAGAFLDDITFSSGGTTLLTDDTDPNAYYDTSVPQAGVKVAGHGVKVTVTGDAGDDLTVSVVNPAAH